MMWGLVGLFDGSLTEPNVAETKPGCVPVASPRLSGWSESVCQNTCKKMTSDKPSQTTIPLTGDAAQECGKIPEYDPSVDYGPLCEQLMRDNEEAERTLVALAEEYRSLRKRLEFFESALRKKPRKTKKRHCRICGKLYLPAHTTLPRT